MDLTAPLYIFELIDLRVLIDFLDKLDIDLMSNKWSADFIVFFDFEELLSLTSLTKWCCRLFYVNKNSSLSFNFCLNYVVFLYIMIDFCLIWFAPAIGSSSNLKKMYIPFINA